jgi:hypothetical protein
MEREKEVKNPNNIYVVSNPLNHDVEVVMDNTVIGVVPTQGTLMMTEPGAFQAEKYIIDELIRTRETSTVPNDREGGLTTTDGFPKTFDPSVRAKYAEGILSPVDALNGAVPKGNAAIEMENVRVLNAAQEEKDGFEAMNSVDEEILDNRRSELEDMNITSLKEMAESRSVDTTGIKRKLDLVDAIITDEFGIK